MAEKKKSKKGCLVSLVLTILGCVLIGFMLIMAAVSAVNTEGSRQESVATVQTSNLNTYINTRSAVQIAIVNAAQNEHTSRGGTGTRGGDSYIEALTQDQVSHGCLFPFGCLSSFFNEALEFSLVTALEHGIVCFVVFVCHL